MVLMQPSPELAIRAAGVADAASLATMWQRSIRELCYEDHQGRADVIETWCSQKTPAALAAALVDPALYWLVAADRAGAVVGVGLLGSGGLIQAIYVDPSVVGHGLGSQLLLGLEREIRRRGRPRATLESTATAYTFYRKHGFVDAGPPLNRFGGVASRPMRKDLEAAATSVSAGVP